MIKKCGLKIPTQKEEEVSLQDTIVTIPDPARKARYWSCLKMVDGGYSEYGYRGLEELKKANEKIAELQKQIEELKKG